MTSAGLSVCVVDDDADIREVLTDVLSIEGYDVVAAGDGESALALLRARPSACRLILLDLMMPRMNGWEFRRQQLQDPTIAEIPVRWRNSPDTRVTLWEGAKAFADPLRVRANFALRRYRLAPQRVLHRHPLPLASRTR